jgi:hypothetical protein
MLFLALCSNGLNTASKIPGIYKKITLPFFADVIVVKKQNQYYSIRSVS